jgi:hypothetical protein
MTTFSASAKKRTEHEERAECSAEMEKMLEEFTRLSLFTHKIEGLIEVWGQGVKDFRLLRWYADAKTSLANEPRARSSVISVVEQKTIRSCVHELWKQAGSVTNHFERSKLLIALQSLSDEEIIIVFRGASGEWNFPSLALLRSPFTSKEETNNNSHHRFSLRGTK